MATAAQRQRLSGERRKRGVRPVQVEVSAQEIDFLRRCGYGARPDDPVSVTKLCPPTYGDWVLEATDDHTTLNSLSRNIELGPKREEVERIADPIRT